MKGYRKTDFAFRPSFHYKAWEEYLVHEMRKEAQKFLHSVSNCFLLEKNLKTNMVRS